MELGVLQVLFIYICSLGCILILLANKGSETSGDCQMLRRALKSWKGDPSVVVTDKKIHNLLPTQLDALRGNWSIFHPPRISHYGSFQMLQL